MISRNCHFTHLIHFIFRCRVKTLKRVFYLLFLLGVIKGVSAFGAEFNNTTRSNSLDNDAIPADIIMSLIHDNSLKDSQDIHLELDALIQEARSLSEEAMNPAEGNSRPSHEELSRYITLLDEADRLVIFGMVDDTSYSPFFFTLSKEDAASIGINTDFDLSNNQLAFDMSNQFAHFIWPVRSFQNDRIGSFTSKVHGRLWQAQDTFAYQGSHEVITGELTLSFQDDNAALRFISSQGTSSVTFSLEGLSEDGHLLTNGMLFHGQNERPAAITLGLLRADRIESTLQFNTIANDNDPSIAGFVTSLPYDSP